MSIKCVLEGQVKKPKIWNNKYQRYGYIDLEKNLIIFPKSTVLPNSIDTIAWGELTYKEIFEEKNLLGNLSFDKEYPPDKWEIVKDDLYTDNTVERSSEEYLTDSQSLKIVSKSDDGTTSNLQSVRSFDFIENNTYYQAISCKVLKNEYPSTTNEVIGIRTYDRIGRQSVSTDFVFITDQKTIEKSFSQPIEIGCINSSSGPIGFHSIEGFVDRPILLCVNALWDNMPSKIVLDILYKNYIQLKIGGTPTSIQYEEERFELPIKKKKLFSDEECLTQFMESINEKAAELNMTNSKFITPSGIAIGKDTNITTAFDMSKLGIAMCQNNYLLSISSKSESQIINLGGSNLRTMTVNPGTPFATFESLLSDSSCSLLAGKGGSWNGMYSFLGLALSSNKDLIITFVHTSGQNHIKATAELIILANSILLGKSSPDDELTTSGVVSAIACLYYPGLTLNYQIKNPNIIYSFNEEVVINPASTTKVLSALVALDYTSSPNTLVLTIKELDDVGYSGANLYLGEKLTLNDAMIDMLLPSSNTAAYAVGRTIGYSILQTKYELNR